MKAKRLVDGKIVNPFFSYEKRKEARAKGQPYDVQKFLICPAGEVVDDPDCWTLCIGDDAVMVPVDEECRQAVLNAMTEPKRVAFLRNLQRQNTPEMRKQMGKGQLEWLDEMLKSYGGEVAALDSKPAPAESKAPVTKKPTTES
jgi:hypothetical protein